MQARFANLTFERLICDIVGRLEVSNGGISIADQQVHFSSCGLVIKVLWTTSTIDTYVGANKQKYCQESKVATNGSLTMQTQEQI